MKIDFRRKGLMEWNSVVDLKFNVQMSTTNNHFWEWRKNLNDLSASVVLDQETNFFSNNYRLKAWTITNADSLSKYLRTCRLQSDEDIWMWKI